MGGMSRARIYEWLAAYREDGFEALKAKQISGRPKKLTDEQIRELYTWITTFTPDQQPFQGGKIHKMNKFYPVIDK